MTFPIDLSLDLSLVGTSLARTVTIHHGMSVLLGPNGSGKTQLLRAMKESVKSIANPRKVRFISAGRMGMLEEFRSDYDGHRTGGLRYDQARHGTKDDAARRHLTETLNGDFQTIAERPDIFLKIQERLRKLFKRDLLVSWDAGYLKIHFARLTGDATAPYSSGREASGLLHLVGILSAIYDDEVGALLIDEPEVSLHPQLQAFLLKELLGVAGHPSEGGSKKMVVIATHSTELIQIAKPSDLLSLVFCYDVFAEPVQIKADADELKSRKLQYLIARLGQEHKLALFSRRPLLVEGPSDVIVCSAIASKLDLHLEAGGSQLLPVTGKGQMPVVVKLMRLLGKNPVVLSDADGIADGPDLVNQFLGQNDSADAHAARLGFPSATQMANGIYSDFTKLVSSRYQEISALAEKHAYWIERKDTPTEQARRRAVLCALYISDTATLKSLDPDGSWLTMRCRFDALLDLLETCGCFILRRGSIEAYFINPPSLASIGKPIAAAEEMEAIGHAADASVTANYSDVLRAIRSAADIEEISETEALRDFLLAAAAPAFGKFQDGGTIQEIRLAVRSMLGEKANLFDMEITASGLKISIASRILDVEGFPLVLRKGDDIVRRVNSALALSQDSAT